MDISNGEDDDYAVRGTRIFCVKPFLFFRGASSPGTARFVPHNAPTLTKVDNLMKKVDSSPLDYETFSKLMEDIPWTFLQGKNRSNGEFWHQKTQVHMQSVDVNGHGA